MDDNRLAISAIITVCLIIGSVVAFFVFRIVNSGKGQMIADTIFESPKTVILYQSIWTISAIILASMALPGLYEDTNVFNTIDNVMALPIISGFLYAGLYPWYKEAPDRRKTYLIVCTILLCVAVLFFLQEIFYRLS